MLVEAFYGWQADSLALLSDAGHNLSDVLGLLVAWGGFYLARLRPNRKHTYVLGVYLLVRRVPLAPPLL